MTEGRMGSLVAGRPQELDVLVVDDDEAGLFDLTASLRRAGLTCASASNGRKALETLARGAMPSVVVTDIRMAGLNGLELARRVAKLDAPELPEIVFISGNTDLGDAVHAIRLGARDLLTKPIDLRRLIRIVREIREERQTLSLPVASTSQPGPASARTDTATQGSHIDVKSMSSVVLNSLRNLQRLRSEKLPSVLAAEASWEILLDLYVSELRGEPISLTAVAGSAGIPLTSAMRRIRELEDKGMILRTPDEKDRRRAAASLTDKGRNAVQSFIRSYLTSCGTLDHQKHADDRKLQDRRS